MNSAYVRNVNTGEIFVIYYSGPQPSETELFQIATEQFSTSPWSHWEIVDLFTAAQKVLS